MKWLQLGLLALIAAALVWGADSVRSFPRRALDAATAPEPPSARPWHAHCWKVDGAGREVPHTEDVYFDTVAPPPFAGQGRMCLSWAPKAVSDAWFEREMNAWKTR